MLVLYDVKFPSLLTSASWQWSKEWISWVALNWLLLLFSKRYQLSLGLLAHTYSYNCWGREWDMPHQLFGLKLPSFVVWCLTRQGCSFPYNSRHDHSILRETTQSLCYRGVEAEEYRIFATRLAQSTLVAYNIMMIVNRGERERGRRHEDGSVQGYYYRFLISVKQ